MSEIRDYPSRLTEPHSRKFETFSYLPRLTAEQIRKQVKYIVKQGWNPAIEHTEPEEANSSYWYMWKLPMFGETDVDKILSEAQLCHNGNPNHHVRIIGYDNLRQTQGMATVVYRAPGFE
ncbi:ribulose bisphosphate carboxylase small subunit [Vibrio hepatarius]|uniref:ribulose bisphosphate carboxylase small subunit n=1 Tax=Vibrio hepatarius TaxID=171383 RepID=UPI00142E3708|nr:ribulose bisphosphate carboxylase small subunit [Vibrio hepatarius]NIY85429.1 ribulose bisphosphate carboxylase small subunit [Vibrio hepatarius]NVJ57807.1 ribulose bisphosphate carboxylase small subunit [Vibrionaceae bacterium]